MCPVPIQKVRAWSFGQSFVQELDACYVFFDPLVDPLVDPFEDSLLFIYIYIYIYIYMNRTCYHGWCLFFIVDAHRLVKMRRRVVPST